MRIGRAHMKSRGNAGSLARAKSVAFRDAQAEGEKGKANYSKNQHRQFSINDFKEKGTEIKSAVFRNWTPRPGAAGVVLPCRESKGAERVTRRQVRSGALTGSAPVRTAGSTTMHSPLIIIIQQGLRFEQIIQLSQINCIGMQK